MTNFFDEANSPAAPASPDSTPESTTTTQTGNFFAEAAEPEGPQPGLISDLITHTRSAFVSSYGADAKAIGLITGNERIEGWGDQLFKVSDDISQGLSRDAVEGQQKNFVEDDDIGRTQINMRGELVDKHRVGEAFADIDSWNALLGSAIGSLGAVVSGGGITKLGGTMAARSIGKAFGRQAARKAAVEKALKEGGEEAAKSVLKKQAAREAATDSAIGTLAYGVNEGLMVGGSAAKDVEDHIMQMPGDVLSQAPLFQEVYWGLRDEGKIPHEQAFEEARKTTAKSLGTTAVYKAGIPSVLLGMVAGRFLDKALTGKLEGSRAMRAAKGVATEGVTEGGQGAVEHLAKGYSIQEADEDFDPYKGLANAAVSEALGGSMAGGALGFASPGGVEAEVKDRKKQNKANAADIESEIQKLEESAEYEQSLEAARQQIMPNFDALMPLDGGTKVEAGKTPEGTVDYNPYAQQMQPLDLPQKESAPENTVEFEKPEIDKPSGAGLSLQPKEQQGEGIAYDPPSRADILAGNVQNQINRREREAEDSSLNEQANFFAENEQADDLPEAKAADAAEKQGLSRRFGNPAYRGAVESMAKDLVKGGDVSYIRDENDRITGRTGSVNPQWFQSNDDMGSVDYVKQTIEKALKGEKLGKKQQRVIEALMDVHESENQYDREELGEYGSLDPADDRFWRDETGKFRFDPADGHGARTVAMLEEEALEAGVSRETLEALIGKRLPMRDHAEALYAEVKRANPRGHKPRASEVPGGEGAQDSGAQQARDGQAAPDSQGSDTERLSDTGDTVAVAPQKTEQNQQVEKAPPGGDSDSGAVDKSSRAAVDKMRQFLIGESDKGRMGHSDVEEAVDIATFMGSDYEVDDNLWRAINKIAQRNPAGLTAKAEGRNLEGIDLSPKEAREIRDRILKAADSPHAVDSRGYSEVQAELDGAKAEAPAEITKTNGQGFASEKALNAALKGRGLNPEEYRAVKQADGTYIGRQFSERKVSKEETEARQAAVAYMSWMRGKGATSIADLEVGVYQGHTFEPGDKSAQPHKISKSGILVDGRFKFSMKQLWDESAEQKQAEIEAGANEADTNPSEAQKEAGNYRKGRITVHGIDIGIENPAGSVRSGTRADGSTWENKLLHHYGDVTGVKGADGDQLDVFVNAGGNPEESRTVYVIDQTDADGKFDEHKVMLGFRSESAAVKGYKANYDAGWKVGPVTEMTIEEFHEWIDEGDTTQPLSEELQADDGIESESDQELLKYFTPFRNYINDSVLYQQFRAEARAGNDELEAAIKYFAKRDPEKTRSYSTLPLLYTWLQAQGKDNHLSSYWSDDFKAMVDDAVARTKAEGYTPEQVKRHEREVYNPDHKHDTVSFEDVIADLKSPFAGGRGETAAEKNSELPPKSTAPEHAMVGVDERELSDIVAEFAAAMKAQKATGVHHQFDEPTKDDITRLGQKTKVYHKDHGWMTPAQAKKRIAEWKAKAKAQGEDKSTNSHRIVLSLFDLTGSWSKPWEEAGYQVFRFDIQDDPDVGDVNNFSSEFFSDWFGDFEGQDIYAILAACPCTDFASSGARHFAAKDKDGRTVASVNLVHQTLKTIEYFKPSIWALENPVGRIEKLGGLPPWRLSFDPNDLGDTYTKKTLIWGNFNSDLPIAPVDPVEGSKMHRLYGGKSIATKNARSATPEGFSYGFFMANNAVDHPIIEAAGKYDRLDRDLLQQALDAGLSMSDIDHAVEDAYYMELDDAAAEEALREAIDERAEDDAPPERRDTKQHEIYNRRTEDMSEAELREYVEQLRGEILTDERTGLGSNRAWIQRDPKKFVASIDLDSLKWVNDNMGHGAGDEMIALVGEALRQGGIGADSYHVSGDEFYAQADDFATLTKALNRARKWLEAQVVSGNDIDYTGPGFSFGIARDLHEAENNLQKDKSKREETGGRAGRGERPAGAVDANKRDERKAAADSSAEAAGDGATGEVVAYENRFDTPVDLIKFRRDKLPNEAGPYGHDGDDGALYITQQRYDAETGEHIDVKLTDKELTDLVNNRDEHAARAAKRRERAAEDMQAKQEAEAKRNAAKTRKMRKQDEVRRSNGEPFTNRRLATFHLNKWKLGATHYVEEISWRPHPLENVRPRFVLKKFPDAPLGKVDVRYETYRDGKDGYFDMVSISGDFGGFDTDRVALMAALDIKSRKAPAEDMAADSYDGPIDRSGKALIARVKSGTADTFMETVELLQMDTNARIQAMYDEEVAPAAKADPLLEGMPEGAVIQKGMGLAKNKWGVFIPGNGPHGQKLLGRYGETKERAVENARSQLELDAQHEKAAQIEDEFYSELAARLKAGSEVTDKDLERLDLKNPARFEYLSPVVQRLFGISKAKVRESMGDALKMGRNDMGTEHWSANPRKALANAAKFTKGNSLTWAKRSPKSWRANDGQIIADQSMTVGGIKIKSFFVFASGDAFNEGNNYASADSLTEAKQIAAEGPPALSSYTEQDLRQREADAKMREQLAEARKRSEESRAKADKERDDFTLTGSDRTADVAAAAGQNSLFNASGKPKEEPRGDLFDRRDPAIEAMLGKIKEVRPEIAKARESGPGYTMDWDQAPWTPAKNGFEARSYVRNGVPYAEIKSPEGNVVTKYLAKDGSIVTDVEGTLDALLSGSAFSSFQRYFEQSQKAVTSESKPEESGRRAKPGGEYGLNGEWYNGGQFMPASAFTVKGAHKVHGGKAGPTRKALVEPGKLEDVPKGVVPIYQRVSLFVDIGMDGNLKVRNDLPQVAFDTHFTNGKAEVESLAEHYNNGARFMGTAQTGNDKGEVLLEGINKRFSTQISLRKVGDKFVVDNHSPHSKDKTYSFDDIGVFSDGVSLTIKGTFNDAHPEYSSTRESHAELAQLFARHQFHLEVEDSAAAASVMAEIKALMAAKPKESKALEDVGEKLGGARKDQVRTDVATFEEADFSSQPLSKIWPKDLFQDLGNKFAEAYAFVARDEIPAKPRKDYKVKRWLEQTEVLRDSVLRVVRLNDSGTMDRDAILAKMDRIYSLERMANRIRLLEGIEKDQWSRIGTVRLNHGTYSYIKGEDGQSVKTPPRSSLSVEIDGRNVYFYGANDKQTDMSEFMPRIQKALEIETNAPSSQDKAKFEIRGRKGYHAINRKGDKEYRPLKAFTGDNSLAEARQYLNENIEALFQAWEDVKARDNVGKADIRALSMSERSGVDHRNGRDVEPEEFVSVFGFRGVEFGNWVKQGSAGRDRQGFVNQGYDALMDLAKLLGIPPSAIALNSRIEGRKGLGLAFGSRGSGSAAAHYESGSNVINLTKTKGAGSLAHEWFHALDTYFQLHRDDPARKANRADWFVTERPEVYYRNTKNNNVLPAADFEPMAEGGKGRRGQKFYTGFKREDWVKVDGVRVEVLQAFAELVQVLDASPMTQRANVIDKGKTDGYWSRIIERAARSFENYIVARMEEEGIQNDFLASFTKIDSFKRNPERYPYLLPEEVAPVKAAFDKLFQTLQTEENNNGTALYSLEGDVTYRIGGNPAAGIEVKAASKVIERLKKKTGVEAQVVATAFDLPPHLLRQVLADNVESSVRGLYDPETDAAYVVAGNLRSEQDAAKVYLHEVLGHQGLRAAVGKKLDVVLTQLYRDMPEAERARIEAKYHRQLRHKEPAEAKRIVADEYVAHLAERDPSNGLLRRVVSMVRNWLRETFKAFEGMQWSESDVIELLQTGRREMARGTKTKNDGSAVYERAQRPVVANSDLMAGWTLLAQDDEVFQLATSGATSLEEVFAEVSNLKIIEEPDLAMAAEGEPEQSWRVVTDNGEKAAIYQKGDSVWIDVSDLSQGSDGREIYNAVANYAYNTGRVFIGDPAGLSDVAASRRLEQMLSSALKFGTTDHLWPHEKQELGFAGVPGIKWKDGDFAHNVDQMIRAAHKATYRQFPDLAKLIYNPSSGEFENKETGHVWKDRDFQQLAALGRKRLAAADRKFIESGGKLAASNPITAGRTTLERAVITNSLLSRESEQGRLRLLASLSERNPRFKGLLYSLNDPDTEVALALLGLGREQRRGLRALINKLKLINYREAWTGLKQRAYEGMFDGLVGIKRAEDAEGVGIGAGDYENSGYVGARLASGIADTMHAILHYGAPRWGDGVIEHVPGTKGLLEVLGELGPDLREWLGWMGGKRAQELKAQGREKNLSNDDIDKLLALRTTENAAKFDAAQKEYAKLNKAMLDLAEGAGLIDPDSRKKWESEWYIPFYRQDIDGNGLLAPRTQRGLSHQSAGIKALRGSEVATNDLLQNLLTNWMKLADASMKNMALLKTVDNLKNTDYFTNESLKYTQAIVPKSEVVKRIKEDRNYLEMVGEMMGLFDAGQLEILHELNKLDSTGFEKLWAITAPRDKNVIRVQRGGKNEYYKVNDEALLRGLVHLSNEGIQNLLMKGARGLKRLLTTGVTAAPDFMARNLFRDAFHAWAINKDKDADGNRQFKFMSSSIEGLKRAFQEDPDYRELMFANASFQGGYVHGADPDASAQAIRRALRKKGLTPPEVNTHMDSLIDKGINLSERGFAKVMRGWEAYRGFGDKLENTNRLATFKAAKRAGKSLAQAVFESKDLMDYSLRGNWTVMNVFTDIVPFLNARLQGLSKLVRAAELSGEPLKPWSWRMDPMMGKAVAKIVLGSMALALWNDDDDDYNALPDWEKDAYWHFFIGGQHFRMPKPFEIGVIAGTLPERMMHAWVLENQPDEKVLWSLQHGLLETLSFNPTPQALVPVFELWGNRSFFFDTPIETMSDQRLLPRDRYNAFTSSTAVWLGQLTGTSPKQLEHLWKGYTGTMGGYALWGVDALVGWAQDKPNRGTVQPADIAVLKSFWRGSGPMRSTQWTTDLYNRLKEANQLVASFKEIDDPRARREFLTENKDKMSTRAMLEGASRTLRDLRKQQKRLLEMDIPAREKQRRLDQIQRRINEVAEQASRQSEFAF